MLSSTGRGQRVRTLQKSELWPNWREGVKLGPYSRSEDIHAAQGSADDGKRRDLSRSQVDRFFAVASRREDKGGGSGGRVGKLSGRMEGWRIPKIAPKPSKYRCFAAFHPEVAKTSNNDHFAFLRDSSEAL